MPNNFIDHKDRWLSMAESDSDFPILFIRNWIPFNAWYCNSYPQHNNHDRPILDEMKMDNNLFRTRIVSLLEGTDSEANQFKNYLENLHINLEKYYIPTTSKRISFQNIYFRENPDKNWKNTLKYKRIEYDCIAEYLSTKQTKISLIENRTKAYKFTYTHTKYDLDHLLLYSNYISLDSELQIFIKSCYDAINPKKPDNLISKNKKLYINTGNIKFVNDSDLLSQAIIEILYNLRCILFHGELIPSKDNLISYEYAYYMLKILLKSLK